MLFNSYIFILAFLPICLLGFYVIKGKKPELAKLWLVGMSLWFYGYFNLSYLLIMLFSLAFNYCVYSLMTRNKDHKKHLLVLGIVTNLSVLFYFKYYDFFIENCNAVFGSDIPLKGILLPLGISFFTFQQIGFLADTYRGEVENCSLLNYSLFVTFFPQLIAGPIVNQEEMLPQFKKIGQPIETQKIMRGIYIFILGMGKKVLLADTLGKCVDFAYDNLGTGINGTEAIIAILCYTLQLYFDFSGYCDMAIGLGNMLAIDIPVNFNSPYKAVNIIDFWKRWHITLNRFFTKNIYIPLGGNRNGMAKMYRNLIIVYLISGIWHGAGWNFILWGCMHGVLYIITRAVQNVRNNSHKKNTKGESSVVDKVMHAVSVLATFVFVNIAWVFFRAPSVKAGTQMIRNVFTAGLYKPSEAFVKGFNRSELWYVLKVAHLTNYGFSVYILTVVTIAIALLLVFFGKNVHELADRTKYSVSTAVMLGIVFVWSVLSLSEVGTFLYFNF